MKKTVAILSLIICLSLAMQIQAYSPVIVEINGSHLQSDVPAQIIDGRTMIPLGAIAQHFNCDVSWEPVIQKVTITSKTGATINHSALAITGPNDFKTFVNEVLNKMDAPTRQFVTQYIQQIIYENPLKIMDSGDKAAMYPNGICRVNGVYFESIKDKISHTELVYGYIGYLAHEATHASIVLSGAEGMYSEQDREALCEIAACKAINRAGGSNSNSYAVFKNSLHESFKY